MTRVSVILHQRLVTYQRNGSDHHAAEQQTNQQAAKKNREKVDHTRGDGLGIEDAAGDHDQNNLESNDRGGIVEYTFALHQKTQALGCADFPDQCDDRNRICRRNQTAEYQRGFQRQRRQPVNQTADQRSRNQQARSSQDQRWHEVTHQHRHIHVEGRFEDQDRNEQKHDHHPVSYTHLTLPTN